MSWDEREIDELIDKGVSFSHSIDELDKLLDEEDRGAVFSVDPDFRRELDLRRKQREADESGENEYEDEEFLDLVQEQIEKMEKLEKEKANSPSREKKQFRKLSAEQMKQLEADMEGVYVRNAPHSEYNKLDSELSKDREELIIKQKLARLRNAYYDCMQWREATKVMLEAIEYSLKHDYPWMSEEQAFDAFKKGRIKFKLQIPKLYMGFGTKEITDKEILKGILTGEITILEREDEEEAIRKRNKKKRQTFTPCIIPYGIVSDEEYEKCVKLFHMGYDSPLGVAIKHKTKIFDRLGMPGIYTHPGDSEKERMLQDFDWSQPNAAEIYYNIKHGIKVNDQTRLIQRIIEVNGGLDPIFRSNIEAFTAWMNNGGVVRQTSPFDSINKQVYEPTDTAVQIENSILDSIRNSNPNL